MKENEIKKYLDCKGRVIDWPSSQKGKDLVCMYLASFFEVNKIYKEIEITKTICNYHCFMNPTMLRRELVVRKYLSRTPDCSAYWKVKE